MPYSLLEAKSIEQLCKVVDCEHKTAPYVDESKYLVVRTSNVRNGQLLMEGMKYTTSFGFKEWTVRAVPEYGDVLFTREAPAGESCLVPSDKKICMGQRMVMLRVNKLEVDPLFLSMILNTERTKADILRLSIGSTVSRINIADIKKLKIASPPLTEQRKIANILETWDKAISTTERLISNSKQQKKALMQQLLPGKKRLLNDSGKPFDDEWEDVKLKQIVTDFIVPMRDKPKDLTGEIPWCRIEDFNGTYLSRSKSSQGVSLETVKNMNLKVFPKGTLLVSCSADLGRCAITTTELVTNQTFIGLNGNRELSNSLYLYYWITFFSRKLNNLSSGTTISYLSRKEFERFSISQPALKEQEKIAEVLSKADKDIRLLKQQLADLKQEKKALMQQLLTGKRRVSV